MKFFRMIRRIACLTAALAVFMSACLAEGAFEIAEEGLELTEELSVHYPVLSGGADKAVTEQVNSLIREKCRIGEYMTRMALLLSGGSLEADWKGGLLNDVFSCAVSASGAVEDTRPTHVWTAVTADLRDGHEITFEELFTDADTAREKIRAYLEETVAPELSAHLLNSELTPLPEQFYLERSGIMLLYPVEQLSTLSDRAGDIRIGWNVVKDELDPDDPRYDKKISDLQRRYDAQYGKIEAIEDQIDELEDQLRTIRQEKISGDNIYHILTAFDKLYDSFTEAEQKRFMQTFIERIDIYPEKPENGCWIRNIVFNFPIPMDGKEVRELPLEDETMLETVCLLTHN